MSVTVKTDDDVADALECLNRLTAIIGGLGGTTPSVLGEEESSQRVSARPLAALCAYGVMLLSELESTDANSSHVMLDVDIDAPAIHLSEHAESVMQCAMPMSRVEAFVLHLQVRNNTHRLVVHTHPHAAAFTRTPQQPRAVQRKSFPFERRHLQPNPLSVQFFGPVANHRFCDMHVCSTTRSFQSSVFHWRYLGW
jgi:hypothetical protein